MCPLERCRLKKRGLNGVRWDGAGYGHERVAHMLCLRPALPCARRCRWRGFGSGRRLFPGGDDLKHTWRLGKLQQQAHDVLAASLPWLEARRASHTVASGHGATRRAQRSAGSLTVGTMGQLQLRCVPTTTFLPPLEHTVATSVAVVL